MDEVLLGTLALFPYTFTPKGWALCDGRILKINQNQALFTLIGNQYGGDGKITFALPSLVGSEPMAGLHFYIAVQGIFPSRLNTGTK